MKNLNYCSFGLLLCLFINTAIFAQKTKQHKQLLETFNKTLTENNIPGLCFSIIHDDGTSEDYAAGFFDVKNKILLSKQ